MEYLKKIEAMYLYQIAEQYKVSPRTLRRWLKPHNHTINKLDQSRLFTPREIETIYNLLGDPR